jgi:flagellar protein FliO/FliZ
MERGMQFITSLFGGTDNTILNAAFALGIVLVLIVLGLWALKFFTTASQSLGRGRNRRLSVIDSAVVDAKRKIVIIRRDNVEHVIMTGGPTDLVIESGVPVPVPDPVPPKRPLRRPAAAKPAAPTGPVVVTAVGADHTVPREAIDRLGDLARPAPLQPRDSVRQSALLRRTQRPDIPIGPQLRIDNSAGPAADSARTGPVESSNGTPRLAGRNRFFRSIPRRDPV